MRRKKKPRDKLRDLFRKTLRILKRKLKLKRKLLLKSTRNLQPRSKKTKGKDCKIKSINRLKKSSLRKKELPLKYQLEPANQLPLKHQSPKHQLQPVNHLPLKLKIDLFQYPHDYSSKHSY